MKEDFLHSIWKLKHFDLNNLKTSRGQRLKIINFGFHNKNAGPDFLNGLIKLDNTIWAGHIELHVNASEWSQHKHHLDPAYNNVVLHVVYNMNKEAYTLNNVMLPVLELKNRIHENILNKYDNILSQKTWIPCARFIKKINPIKVNLAVERMLIDRLSSKVKSIDTQLNNLGFDWEYLLFTLLLRYFGPKVNAEAFTMLARIIPYKLINTYSYDHFKLEALLLGGAGLLSDVKDVYSTELKNEFLFLKKKHNLNNMTGVEWRFARMRPFGFPTVRMAQIADLFNTQKKLFSKILKSESIKSLKQLLECRASKYWDTHYILGKESRNKPKNLGSKSKDNLIINAIIPLLFAYGKIKQEHKYCEHALKLYYQLPSEKNVIIKNWINLGVSIDSAAQSQALIQLKSQYCDKFRCANCAIGKELLFK